MWRRYAGVFLLLVGALSLQALGAEISVERPLGTSITHGGTDDQGWQQAGAGQVTLTYTVRNTGASELTVTDITSSGPDNVTVHSIAPTSFSLDAGDATEFDVNYTPATDGLFSFDLTITSNAPDYTWTVSGNGDATPPTVPVPLTPPDGAWFNTTSVGFTWEASTDDGSGVRDYRVRIFGPVNRDHYTANTFYNPVGLEEGAYYWNLRARDWVGNHSDYIPDHEFYIDLTPPEDPELSSPSHTVDVPSNNPEVQITATGAYDPISGDVASGVDGFEVAWNQSETWTPTETANRADGWEGETFVATSDGSWWVHVATVDLAGNWTSTRHLGPFQIDTTPPRATVTTNRTTIVGGSPVYEEEASRTLTVTVSYDEDMDQATEPTIELVSAGDNWSGPTGGGWTSATVYTAQFTHDGTEEEILGTAFARVADGSGGTDLAGNAEVGNDSAAFDIDTEKPTVVSVTPDRLTDADVGTVYVSIEFSEPMDMATNPSPTLQDLASSPYTIVGTTWTNGDRTWTGSFLFVDDDEERVGTYRIFGFKDQAGNLMPWTTSFTVDVDTRNPRATVTTNRTTIVGGSPVYEEEASRTLTVTVSYDEDMDQATEPTIELVSAGDNWSGPTGGGWTSATVYTAQFTHDGTEEEILGTAFARVADGSGGTDLAGNAEEGNDSAAFDIDTRKPQIIAITSTTADGYYNAGDINVTVTFSEPVILTGGTLGIVLNTDPIRTVSIDPFGSSETAAATYTIIPGDNACLLDATGVALANGASLRDEAGNDAVIALSPITIGDGSSITVDTTGPVIGGLSLPGGEIAVDSVTCTATVEFSATVTDNCCISADGVTVVVELVPDHDMATLLSWSATTANETNQRVSVTGSFEVGELTGSPVQVRVRIQATDCSGNEAVQAEAVATLRDATAPVITWDVPLPDSPQVVSADTCTITFPVEATVSDACCIDAGNVPISVDVTNATVVHTVTASQVDSTTVRVAGNITVSDLTGCPAVLTAEVDAVDCSGNVAATLTGQVEINDNTIPVIGDLKFNTDSAYLKPETDYYVDACCVTTVYFSAHVTDNCCISPAGVIVDVTLPTGNAVLEDIDVSLVQESDRRVDITGSAVVRCLTSCPARVEVMVRARDCCGNWAGPEVTTVNEGLVWDTVIPIPRDDPRQDMVLDESAIIDPLVEVRLDELGVYRLAVREDTPVRIDVLANDADNCSCRCDAGPHPFDPCGPCGACPGCCADLFIHEIVEQPLYGTVSIEDPAGDCGGGSVIRYAPDVGFVGPDQFTYTIRDACGNVSTEIATVYLQVVRKVAVEDVFLVACSGEPAEFTVTATDLWVDYDPDEIAFDFTVFWGPSHGVVVGDPRDMTDTPPSVTEIDGQLVPTFDFIESTSITLSYISADGYVGRDALRIRFEDPFGSLRTAQVDIVVADCVADGLRVPVIDVEVGRILPLIPPVGFVRIVEEDWESAKLVSLEDGSSHEGALSFSFEPEMKRYVVLVDTGQVPIGEYLLTMPLGNGERVQMRIGVGEDR